jgi:DNA-binding MarR family transcriptional regulator
MPRAGENNIGYLMNQGARLLGRLLNHRLKDLELSQSSYALIRSVAALSDHPVTVTEVAEDLRMEPSAVVHAAERIAEQGWITVERHPEHRRARILKLTPKAKAMMPAIADTGHWTLEAGLNGFTNEEIDQLRAYLQRLVRNLESADESF